MNLIDAIKSGKPFRRQGQPAWKTAENIAADLVHEMHGSLVNQPTQLISKQGRPVLLLTLEELTADDWELQEPTATITRTQFWEAYSNVIKDWQANHAYPVVAYASLEVIVPALARKLGLDGDCP